MNKRGGLFYIIDAFIAASILIITVTVIFSIATNIPNPLDPLDEINNYFNYLHKTKMYNAQTYSTTAEALLTEGVITDPQLSVIQAVTQLYQQGLEDNATDMLAELTPRTLPVQYNINVSIGNTATATKIYGRGSAQSKIDTKMLVHKNTITHFATRTSATTYYQDIAVSSSGTTTCATDKCLHTIDNNTGTPIYYQYGCPQTISINGYRARCEKTTKAEIYGPYTIEVELWP